MIKIDGYPPGGNDYIQRETNTVGDLISGVTLSLRSPGTSTISISNDNAAIKGKIQNFVDSINQVLDYIKQMTAYDKAGNGENNGVMIGNYAFQIVQQRIKDILSSPVPGLTKGVDSYTTLSQIGIHSDPDQDGKWIIDELALDTALARDTEGVCKLFVKNDSSDVDGFAKLIETEAGNLTSEYTNTNPGIVSVLIHNYEGIIKNIDAKVAREERRLAIVENRLNEKFSNLEVALGKLDGQKQYLTSLINALSQGNKSQ
jgi:flagellar hook-associated protein 2